MFINASPVLYQILTFYLGPKLGIPLVLLSGALSGLSAGLLFLSPPLIRKTIITAVSSVVIAGVLLSLVLYLERTSKPRMVTLAAQEGPGEQSHEDRIGHVQDIGLGHSSVLDGIVEAEDCHTVAECPSKQEIVTAGARRLPPGGHDDADHKETE